MRLGSRVTFLKPAPRILPQQEPEVSTAMEAVLEEKGATVLTGAALTAVGREGDRRIVRFRHRDEEHTLAVDQVLAATGRRPNTLGMGLDRAGVEVTPTGAVAVDDQLRTTNPRVLAAGDVTGHPQFVYVAAHEGNLAARNALEGTDLAVDFRSLPRVTFTSPQVASAGLTDEQARTGGIGCACRVLPLAAEPRALVNRDPRGLVKMVAERQGGRIVGATVVADGPATSSWLPPMRSSSGSPPTRLPPPGPRT